MADTINSMVAEVQTIVDVTAAEALTALERRHKRMVAVARAYRKRLTVGPTVAGTSYYQTPGLIEMVSLTVGGVPYSRARRPDIYAASQDALAWTGDGGFVLGDASAAGIDGVTLVPTPDTAGLSIEIFGSVAADDLVAGANLTGVRVDADYFDILIEAAAATFLRREGEGDPESIEARFEEKCEDFRRRVARRFRTSGPAQIRIQGVNA